MPSIDYAYKCSVLRTEYAYLRRLWAKFSVSLTNYGHINFTADIGPVENTVELACFNDQGRMENPFRGEIQRDLGGGNCTQFKYEYSIRNKSNTLHPLKVRGHLAPHSLLLRTDPVYSGRGVSYVATEYGEQWCGIRGYKSESEKQLFNTKKKQRLQYSVDVFVFARTRTG